MTIFEAKKIESKNLQEISRRLPKLFENKTYFDDQNSLEKYGISIPKKKKLPWGYLKLWPQDFIVEEISFDSEQQTIYRDKFLSKGKDFSYDGPIIYATLVKCGLSTIEAVEELAKDLKILPSNIKYAGIKDKHAITSQLISIRGGNAERLHDINHSYFFVKNLFSGNREINLGQLRGNQFTILIRTGPNFRKDQFEAKLAEIKKEGFYNFYYLQRFGVPRLLNYYCGLHILKGEYEQAVKTAFCRPGERELLYFQLIRKEIEKVWGDWEKVEEILDLFPITFQDERKFIEYLIKNPEDFVGALNQLPRVVELWLTSFSALLFNKKLSLDIAENQKVAPIIPLFLSNDKKTWLFYKDLLDQYGIFSMTFTTKNLTPLPFIRLRKRGVRTKEIVEILNYKIIPGGIILNFNLSKGCYATTFLSHLFNLVSGALPTQFSNLPVDTKATIQKPSLEDILNQFQEVVYLPGWKYSWRI